MLQVLLSLRVKFLLALLLLISGAASILFVSLSEGRNRDIVYVLPKDAIPAITDPGFISAKEAEVEGDSPFIGVTFNDESHAYSMNILNRHEIVNDVVGGEEIATTW